MSHDRSIESVEEDCEFLLAMHRAHTAVAKARSAFVVASIEAHIGMSSLPPRVAETQLAARFDDWARAESLVANPVGNALAIEVLHQDMQNRREKFPVTFADQIYSLGMK